MEKPDKDRFDALMKLAEFTCGVRDKRRAIEWRGTFSLWALMVGAIAYPEKISTFSTSSLPLIFLVIIVGHAYWLRTNYVSNARDADKMYDFRNRAARIVIPDYVPDICQAKRKWKFLERKAVKFLLWRPTWLQLGVTIILGIVIILLGAE